ncbi:sensor domain-containing diguanylate cyclase [Vibrio salinus]|uniref:sensor domain-containing diguanylate cyclase n=1 Tax=Vibrio salinus TaxID=2899784 RepID=UPI001E55CF32|nr:sensor domain-containing diguanylate cyclase [Vibrio salinus]MCE0494413.1 sensor domain-containing diguanylate cyclase [Vibrio salinus]
MNRKRFSWILVGLISLGFIVTGYMSYKMAHETLEEQIQQDSLPLTSDNIYSEIQQDLIRPIFISSLMAQDTFVRDWTISGEVNSLKMVHYLKEIKHQYNTVSSFYVSDKTKNYYHYSGVLRKVSRSNMSDSWYFRVKNLKPGKDYEINIDSDTADPSRVVVFVNYRVYDFSHKFLGIIGVGLSSNAVSQIIEKYKKRYERDIYFINDLGDVTLQGKTQENFRSIHDRPGLKNIAQKILTSPSMSGSYQFNGETRYISSRWVDEFQWFIIVEQKDEFNGLILKRAIINNLVISLLVALSVIILAHWVFKNYQSRLETMATKDKLTGVHNRQVFDELVQTKCEVTTVKDAPLSLALLDIDHFKEVNDTYGHTIGDFVLTRVADTCLSHLSGRGEVCRWGGEEFVLVLPFIDKEKALQLLESVRKEIQNQSETPNVTVSIGLVEREPMERVQSMLSRADKAMYKAKKQGRNNVQFG